MMTPEHEREMHYRAVARASERRNRPAGVALFAVVLVILAGGFAISSLGAESDARSAALREARALEEIRSLVREFERLENDPRATQLEALYRREPAFLQKLERIAGSIELDPAPTIRALRPESLGLDSPFVAPTATLTFSNRPLSEPLQWINAAIRRIPGIFVTRIRLQPAANGWAVTVDLARWEMKQ